MSAAKNRKPSPKQIALLNFLSIPVPGTLDEASALIDSAQDTDKGFERMMQWQNERLRLHPELYRAEAKLQKDSRARDLYEHCKNERESYAALDHSLWPFRAVTLAQCRAAVEWLDGHQPGWDVRLHDGYSLSDDIVRGPFLDAIRQVAPQCLKGGPKPETASRKGAAENQLETDAITPTPVPAKRSAADHFVYANGQQQGPLTKAEVRELLDTGCIDSASNYWQPALKDWQPISEFLNT